MAKRYRQIITGLRGELLNDTSCGEAATHIRTLIDKIILTPREGVNGPRVDLYGDLAGILKVSTENQSINEDIEFLTLLKKPVNDYSFPAVVDSVGSGGWQPTASTFYC